jgi:hypothetical protein
VIYHERVNKDEIVTNKQKVDIKFRAHSLSIHFESFTVTIMTWLAVDENEYVFFIYLLFGFPTLLL